MWKPKVQTTYMSDAMKTVMLQQDSRASGQSIRVRGCCLEAKGNRWAQRRWGTGKTKRK